MNRPQSGAVRSAALLTALAVSLPVHSGGARTKSSARSGHQVMPHGVAIFYRHSRNLPNGVSIFNRRPPAVRVAIENPNGKPAGKPTKRLHGNRRGTHEPVHAKRAATETKKHGRARAEPMGHGHSNFSKRAHGSQSQEKHPHKSNITKPIFFGSTVYVQAAEPVLYIPEDPDGNDCRSLTERGYDLSGRRVLVEWTLCFDDRGEAYVPEDGRRIVARY